MKVRFSPIYVDEKNVLTEEGRELRETYISKGGMDASFFNMLMPILCVGTKEETCPKPLQPLLKELLSKGIVVAIKEEKPIQKKKDIEELLNAKKRMIEEDLEKDHVLPPKIKEDIVNGELEATLDITTVKNGTLIVKALSILANELNAKVALIKSRDGRFKGFACDPPVTAAIKIRLETLVYDVSHIYESFSKIDKRIRNDRSSPEPDMLCETITISQTRRAKLYFLSNFDRSPKVYVLAVTTLPDAKDGLVLVHARRTLEQIDNLLR